ncbi:MAG: helix-turn-helix domain-containing protein [Cyclobacteriaceae bacterium]|nr:helix-turn-helix domain-containing protein [Cyclobacteriaceae bacterium]
MANARKKGNYAGRKVGLSIQAQTKALAALQLLERKENKLSVGEIQKRLGINKSTYYRYIRWAEAQKRVNKVPINQIGIIYELNC